MPESLRSAMAGRAASGRAVPSPWRSLAAGVGASILLLAGCGDSDVESQDEPDADADSDVEAIATAVIVDGEGGELGVIDFDAVDGGTQLSVEVSGMEPGFYGLHVHETGLCEPDSAAPDSPEETGDFLSAGGHLDPEDVDHPDHAGDLPALLVNDDGTAAMSVVTDRLDAEVLLDDDRSALIIHADPDNYANIPDRYDPEAPDQETRDTGDSHHRVGCGAVEE